MSFSFQNIAKKFRDLEYKKFAKQYVCLHGVYLFQRCVGRSLIFSHPDSRINLAEEGSGEKEKKYKRETRAKKCTRPPGQN